MGDKIKKIKFSASLILLFFFSEIFANQVNQYTNIYNSSIKENCLKIYEGQNAICSCVKDKWIAHLQKSQDRYDFNILTKHYEKAANGKMPKGPSKNDCLNPEPRSELSRQCANQVLKSLDKIIVKTPFTVDGRSYRADEPVSIKAYYKFKWGSQDFKMKWLAYKEEVKVTSFDEFILFDCQHLGVKKREKNTESSEANRGTCPEGREDCSNKGFTAQ